VDFFTEISRKRNAEKAAREQAEMERLAAELARPINASAQPSSLATAIGLRDVANLRANSKLIAAYIAELTYNSQISAAAVQRPVKIGTKGRVCKQRDFSSPWFLYWAERLKFAPQLHRKLWEDAYVVQCLWERGCLKTGKRGLGFAVGAEPLPSLFAGCGALITATDLSADDERSHDWSLTHQHASNIDVLWKPQLIDRKEFLEKCSFEFVDMTDIPSKFDGQFDFCWSVCAFEHLGTLQNGLEFVRQATRSLKPGGVAVHTTEYNVDNGDTIDNWATVLYQKKHFAALDAMIEEAGCRLVDIDFDAGQEFFDGYVDLPPFPHDASALLSPPPPHIKLSVDGFRATSIAIIVEKPPS
jgi:SAM-dependent methyltransferase